MIFNEQLQQLILKTHRKVFPFPKNWFDAEGEDAEAMIADIITAGKPCLVARFGSIEMEAITAYLYRDTKMSSLKRFYHFASWNIRYKGWHPALKAKLLNNTGFFPTEDELLDKFARLYLETAPQIDILGSWLHAETLLLPKMPNTKHIPLSNMEPYLSKSPWTKSLEGKRVLVIHPFTDSIESQYAKRKLLFKDENVLPDFELITLKAIQSAAGNKTPFNTWFEALDHMKSQIDKINFDIAIIGAGAYGLPLAAHIKDIGRQAVHLGGATQMLFGIYGQRWIDDPVRNKLITDNWTRPADTEKIINSKNIENSCYW